MSRDARLPPKSPASATDPEPTAVLDRPSWPSTDTTREGRQSSERETAPSGAGKMLAGPVPTDGGAPTLVADAATVAGTTTVPGDAQTTEPGAEPVATDPSDAPLAHAEGAEDAPEAAGVDDLLNGFAGRPSTYAKHVPQSNGRDAARYDAKGRPVRSVSPAQPDGQPAVIVVATVERTLPPAAAPAASSADAGTPAGAGAVVAMASSSSDARSGSSSSLVAPSALLGVSSFGTLPGISGPAGAGVSPRLPGSGATLTPLPVSARGPLGPPAAPSAAAPMNAAGTPAAPLVGASTFGAVPAPPSSAGALIPLSTPAPASLPIASLRGSLVPVAHNLPGSADELAPPAEAPASRAGAPAPFGAFRAHRDASRSAESLQDTVPRPASWPTKARRRFVVLASLAAATLGGACATWCWLSHTEGASAGENAILAAPASSETAPREPILPAKPSPASSEMAVVVASGPPAATLTSSGVAAAVASSGGPPRAAPVAAAVVSASGARAADKRTSGGHFAAAASRSVAPRPPAPTPTPTPTPTTLYPQVLPTATSSSDPPPKNDTARSL